MINITPAQKKLNCAVVIAFALLMTCSVQTYAQSSDPDSPTPLASNVIEGEADGQAAVYYYYFAAGPGEVKITVDAKTDEYSTPFIVELQNKDGEQLEQIYVVATAAGKREVKRHKYLSQQKTILRIVIQKDKDVRQLTYKIKVEGEVGLPGKPQPSAAQPATPPTPGQDNSQAEESSSGSVEGQSTNQSDATASAPSVDQSATGQPGGIKEKAKVAARKAATKALDKFPF